jgi:poly(beta-D-mannuronate) lyase
MENSGYDEEDQYLYFKVGVYHVNNSAEEGESAVASFYTINNEHEGYQPR